MHDACVGSGVMNDMYVVGNVMHDIGVIVASLGALAQYSQCYASDRNAVPIPVHHVIHKGHMRLSESD